jgi:membrane protein CcdC involved in cytochrome C biogenesis
LVAVPSLKLLSLVSSIVGAAVVMLWRVSETRSPISARKILIPPMGMATGFAMFLIPVFRIPWTWAIDAFLLGALVFAYPLLRTSRLVREGDYVMLQRSNAFLAVLLVLAGVRIGARGYLDQILSVQQTAALFFILAFGMILRWRARMYIEYRALTG